MECWNADWSLESGVSQDNPGGLGKSQKNPDVPDISRTILKIFMGLSWDNPANVGSVPGQSGCDRLSQKNPGTQG